MTKVRYEYWFKCSKCGLTALKLPNELTDISVVRCKACGKPLGLWGKIKKVALAKVIEHPGLSFDPDA